MRIKLKYEGLEKKNEILNEIRVIEENSLYPSESANKLFEEVKAGNFKTDEMCFYVHHRFLVKFTA